MIFDGCIPPADGRLGEAPKNSNQPKIMKPTKTCIALASSVVLIASMPFAAAVATMRISHSGEPSNWTVIEDEGTLDEADGIVGSVSFLGTFGNWWLSVTTGITKPAVGTEERPFMDVNFVAASSTPGGTLVIEFSETDFGPMAPNTNYVISIGGTTNGTLNCTTLVDVNNVLFAGDELGNRTFGPGAFACDVGAPGTYTSPFSLTKRITIDHGAGGTLVSSGDTEITVPDGGTTIAMLGLSLLGLGALRKKQNK